MLIILLLIGHSPQSKSNENILNIGKNFFEKITLVRESIRSRSIKRIIRSVGYIREKKTKGSSDLDSFIVTRKRWRIMGAGWKSNSKTLANTVDGLSGLFIATGSRVFESLFHSLTGAWRPRGSQRFSKPLGRKVVTKFRPDRHGETSSRHANQPVCWPFNFDSLTVDAFSKDF